MKLCSLAPPLHRVPVRSTAAAWAKPVPGEHISEVPKVACGTVSSESRTAQALSVPHGCVFRPFVKAIPGASHWRRFCPKPRMNALAPADRRRIQRPGILPSPPPLLDTRLNETRKAREERWKAALLLYYRTFRRPPAVGDEVYAKYLNAKVQQMLKMKLAQLRWRQLSFIFVVGKIRLKCALDRAIERLFAPGGKGFEACRINYSSLKRVRDAQQEDALECSKRLMKQWVV